MEIGKILRASNEKVWRKWLEKNHSTEKDIWLVFYSKSVNKKWLTYNEALDEALCFGWIDSIVKKLDAESRVQRFSPRKSKSPVSTLNKEKIKRLQKLGKMTPAGLAVVGEMSNELNIPKYILTQLKKDPDTWRNFQRFPDNYKRVRISWITDLPASRGAEKQKRLRYFLKKTKENKTFGTI